MSRAHQTRLPLRPLIAAARAEGASDLARILNVPRRRVQEWNANGIPYYRADELAARLGYLAFELWPDFHTIPDYCGDPLPDGEHGPTPPYVHPSTINPADAFADLEREATA